MWTFAIIRGLARLASALWTFVEVFDEAQRQAAAARHRYPFIDC